MDRRLPLAAAIAFAALFTAALAIVPPPGIGKSFISPGGPMNIYLGGTLFIVFFLGLGVATSLKPERSRR